VRVAALQHDVAWEDRPATLAELAPRVGEAAAAGAQLVLLTEMFAVGFSMATERIAEPVGGPTSGWLCEQAAAHGVWIGGSVPELAPGDERPSNTFVLAGPDGTQHRYAKRHPFSYGGEDRCYRAGDDPLTVTAGDLRLSLAVCYDLRFADQFWAQAPATDAYLVVANWPAARQHHWRALLVARAIENQAYVVGVNRVGTDGNGLAYVGGSCIVDPLGVLVADAGEADTAIAADVDPEVVGKVRARYPFLADRR
jgi:predicted amidohydrolase